MLRPFEPTADEKFIFDAGSSQERALQEWGLGCDQDIGGTAMRWSPISIDCSLKCTGRLHHREIVADAQGTETYAKICFE